MNILFYLLLLVVIVWSCLISPTDPITCYVYCLVNIALYISAWYLGKKAEKLQREKTQSN